MNAKKFLAALICALMLMQCAAFAADISPEAVVYVRPALDEVKIDQIGPKVYIDITTVEGTTPNDSPIMAYMYYDDEFENGGYENIFGKLHSEYSLIGVVYSPVNGDMANLELYPSDVSSGKRYVAVALYNAGDVYQEEIFYVCKEDVEAFVSTINNSDEAAVKEAMSTYYYALPVVDYKEAEQLTSEDYEALEESGAAEAFATLVANGVNGEYSEDKGSFTYENAAAFLKEAYLIAAYNEGDFTDEELSAIVYKHADAVGIDTSENSVYGKVQGKDTVVKIAKTMDETVESADDLSEVLEKAVSVQIVNETHWLNLVNVVNEHNELFGVDEDEIEKLLDSKKLRNKFCEEFKGTYYSVDEIKDAWDDAYKAAKKAVDKESSGGGGGGVAFGDKVVVNTVSTQISDTENNYDPNVEILDYYTDMGEYSWASDAILNLTKKEIVAGYGDKTFAPANSLTRAEFMKMLVNVFGFADITATSTFTDVDPNAWYYVYVASAEKLGLAQGYGNGMFGVNDPVTRQDAVTLIYRAAKAKGLSTEKFKASVIGLKDKGEIAPYAVEAVEALYNAGVFLDASNPKSVDVFEPTRNATRAYVAVLLNQLYIYMN